MNGLELSRRYYNEYGKKMLESEFPDLMKYIAAGFVGSGSDRYGFDDEISRDHDFEPGFCIFLPDENIVDRRTEFLLERAYAKLPKEFCGITRQPISPVGGNRNGVFRTERFYRAAVGEPDGNLTVNAWLHIPDYALAEATNGEVFWDGYGEFTAIREKIMKMPDDIKRKRLAGNILLMAQSGQYNYARCIGHHEPDAAQLACFEFVGAAMKSVFLLHDRYMPYYKWSFRALRKIDQGEYYADGFSDLLIGDNSDPFIFEKKKNEIEEISANMISLLRDHDLTSVSGDDLERHAYSVNDRIADHEVRNMHILAAV